MIDLTPPVAMTVLKTPAAWVLHLDKHTYRCSIGRSGVTQHKREGDGATPIGEFPFRAVYYRPDRIRPNLILTGLVRYPIARNDAWCDDPHASHYNRLVKLPFTGSYEPLWLAPSSYDVFVVIGYNDCPVRPGRGSAIFFHVAKKDYSPTAGCIAVSQHDLLEILPQLTPHSRIRITQSDITLLK